MAQSRRRRPPTSGAQKSNSSSNALFYTFFLTITLLSTYLHFRTEYANVLEKSMTSSSSSSSSSSIQTKTTTTTATTTTTDPSSTLDKSSSQQVASTEQTNEETKEAPMTKEAPPPPENKDEEEDVVYVMDEEEASLDVSFDETNQSVAYITYATLEHRNEWNVDIFPALTTWLTGRRYYVVLPIHHRIEYETKFCRQHRNYCQRIHPVWVLCQEGTMGAPTCCQCEQALSQMLLMTDDDDDDDDESEFPSYQWYAFHHSTTYWRRPYLEEYLAKVDSNKPIMVASAKLQSLGLEEDHDNACTKQQDDDDFLYPYAQPMILSRGAMKMLTKPNVGGLDRRALTKECETFGWASVDVGMQIMGWMYSLPVLKAAFAQGRPDQLLVVNGNGEQQQQDHVLGMVDIGRVGDSMTVQECHEYYSQLDQDNNNNNMTTTTKEDKKKKRRFPPYKYHRPKGFAQTRLFEEWGDPKSWSKKEPWHTMEPQHCNRREGT